MLEQLTVASLSEQLNTKFRLSVEPETFVELELVKVETHDDVPGQTERFSALFRGSLNQFLPQSTYAFEHEALGSFELFIVPLRQDGEGFYYEAVFNRVQ
ncbi:MAG TPA: hypothetical protein VGB76_17500 [Pyrinomonadaceae bacterium]|jgi:hypothetical protein